MAGEVPCATYMALLISLHIVNNGRSSSSQHWKLNLSSGTVEQASTTGTQAKNNTVSRHHTGSTTSTTTAPVTNSNTYYDDTTTSSSSHEKINNLDHNHNEDSLFKELSKEERMIDIISNSNRLFPFASDHNIGYKNGRTGERGDWIVTADHLSSTDTDSSSGSNNRHSKILNNKNKSDNSNLNLVNSTVDFHKRDLTQQKLSKNSKTNKKQQALTCGKPANISQYDHLKGVSERHHHVHVAEPDVAMLFKGFGKTTGVDISQLENKLRKAKQDIVRKGNPTSEKTCHVYNLIGNFWRIKGDTQKSVECFRKALSISPYQPDVLLNLARVLLNLQYLDDAIFLARKSLHHLAVDDNSWLQHYTMGEILKSYGDTQEAILHFRKAVELNPSFLPTKSHLRELDFEPQLPSVTHLTLFIIMLLVVGVMFFLSAETTLSMENNGGSSGGNSNSHSSSSSNSDNGSGGSGSSSGKGQSRHFNRAMAMRSIKLGINPRMCRMKKCQSS